ncbi:MAG: late competence development ComFB family protein, partial [Oscillospiraceae bacterium]|nr:late competence development ComFB family protein [Oscillospiraceae bacterium]
VPAPVPVPEPVLVPTPKPVPDSPASPSKVQVDSDTTYVNVAEVLVEEKAMKYIKMFGLCTCPRCVADVKALALNRLPPKYVVMRTGEMIPRITLYEGQFSAAVTAQILTACNAVMQNPRHDPQ